MLIGKTPKIQIIRQTIKKIASQNSHPITVLILGETGSGKDEVAKLFHESSNLCKNVNYVTVNCSAIPSELLENTLFGHQKGSFTGAVTQEDGLFHKAEGGILFLDEIGDLPLPLQPKLLRVLEESKILRVGATKTESIHIQLFIFATNQPLHLLLKNGQFRNDLYFRISSFLINIPPLRERVDDIPLLVEHFLKKLDQTGAMQFSPMTIEVLKQHPWPGNVRELKNVLMRCLTLEQKKLIQPEDVKKYLYENNAHLLEHVTRKPNPELHGSPYKEYIDYCKRHYFERLIERFGRESSILAEKSGVSQRQIQKMFKKFDL
jgi:DNA-binding NtrC family response regulator